MTDKNLTTVALLLSTMLSAPLQAMNLVPVSADSAGAIRIAYKMANAKEAASNTFLSNETIQLNFTLTIAEQDVGQTGQLFLVAYDDHAQFMLTASRGWQPWDGQLATLAPVTEKVLQKQETLTVLNQQTLPPGEFLVYAGYVAGNTPGLQNNQNSLFYNAAPAAFAVFDNNSPTLHQIIHKSVLTELFDLGSKAYRGQTNVSSVGFSPAAPIASASAGGGAATSQTNLQEIGVDEADRIKVDGDRLFALEKCAQDLSKQCISAYQMQESPAATTALGTLALGNTAYQDALYTVQNSVVNTQKQLVHIGSSMGFSIFDTWFLPYYWGDNKTNIEFVDATQPANMRVKSVITLNTALLSSRVVDNVLYVVTRKNPHFYYPTATNPVALGDSASPLTAAQLEDSVQLIQPQPVTPPKDIDTLLPTITFNDGEAKPLLKATDCYVPAQSSDKTVDNTLVAVTAIPLLDPASYYSVCVAGSVDTFYMSTQALYLATTRYPWQLSGNSITYDNKQASVTTELHKFKLAKNALVYSGSGVVPGHLGWEPDKQAFRMGEYNNLLKVATSQGDTWNDTATTRVSVLQEDSANKTLKEIGVLDNLGKKGERLYAARFIQDHGFLVTFKTTDPLYVLDFKEPTKPQILGELQVNGYSDYLHPLGDNYLLGIGKDAIADTAAGTDNRGAWYQGLKLSLFELSPTLRELESVVIGKRGTDSGALYDHHALAWLPSASNNAKGTLAIPVELHNNLYPATQLQYYGNNYYSFPYAYYDWTHTGLYTFSIDVDAKPPIQLSRRLLAGVNDASTYYSQDWNNRSTYDDRAVIQGGAVHYIHNNHVLSAAIVAAQ